MKEIVPEASRIAALWNPANFDFQIVQVKEAEIAAQQSGVQLQLFETRGPNEFDAAFAAIDRAATQALLILTDPLFVIHRQPLIDFRQNDTPLPSSAIGPSPTMEAS